MCCIYKVNLEDRLNIIKYHILITLFFRRIRLFIIYFLQNFTFLLFYCIIYIAYLKKVVIMLQNTMLEAFTGHQHKLLNEAVAALCKHIYKEIKS